MSKTKINFQATVYKVLVTKNDNDAITKSRFLKELGLDMYFRRVGLWRGEFVYILDSEKTPMDWNDIEKLLKVHQIKLTHQL